MRGRGIEVFVSDASRVKGSTWRAHVLR